MSRDGDLNIDRDRGVSVLSSTPSTAPSSLQTDGEAGQTVSDAGLRERKSHDVRALDEHGDEEEGIEDDKVSDELDLIPSQSPNGNLPLIEEDEQPETVPPKEEAVTWRSLPRRDQLAILTMARLSEPLTQTSLQAYMFYQLKSFDPTLPDSSIAKQAGMLQGSFAAAQFVTAILWGRVADADWSGRKKVLLVGLLGTCMSCVGFGFSRSFAQAVAFRILGGALNGNVGVMRTMIAEIIKEKRFQSRAFLLLPMCFNIGVIIGPVLGGLLADPVGSYPKIFGAGSVYGGKDGVWWMKKWPYALPNLLSACFLFTAAVGVFLGLEETLENVRHRRDYGLRVGRFLANKFRQIRDPIAHSSSHSYTVVAATDEEDSIDLAARPSTTSAGYESPDTRMSSSGPPTAKPLLSSRAKRKLPFSTILTRGVLTTLLSHTILAFHVGTFNNLWYIFLSTPRPSAQYTSAHPPHLPFHFTGGLALPPPLVGTAMAILGLLGITLQLTLYPPLQSYLGTLRSYRLSLLCFPIAYTLAPYLSLIPSSSPSPHPASGPLVWIALSCVVLVQVLGRTFALPSNIILLNNCAPHPSVLGTVHGVGQSASSGARMLGPLIGGWLFGVGLDRGVVGGVWWGLAGAAVVGWIASGFVREGGGVLEAREGNDEEG
ncbi:MAG: hypothetical protein M1819_003008 [Sarea resinae]|nr:MAG: hypothetical protein M1819_003008 [Sarea resinae]